MNILQCHQYVPGTLLDILHNDTDLLWQKEKRYKTLKIHLAMLSFSHL